jgi:hypothetical protein
MPLTFIAHTRKNRMGGEGERGTRAEVEQLS